MGNLVRTLPRGRSCLLDAAGADAAGADAASGAGDDEEVDADLTSYLSEARTARLSETQKADLRQIVKKNGRKQHFFGNREAWQATASTSWRTREIGWCTP